MGPERIVVVSMGAAYVVDAETRQAHELAWPVSYAEYVAGQDIIVVGNGLWFVALGAAGEHWLTRRISWDGMRAIRCDGAKITGEAYTPMGPPDWLPFEVDLASGEVEGGSYHGPP